MNEKKLFAEICEASLLEQYESELSECEESASCSRKHYRRMSRILGVTVGPSRYSKKLVILLVAAAVLLSACFAYLYRKTILNGLALEISEDYIKAVGEGPALHEIEEPYCLSYIPAGYELTKEMLSSARIYYTFENANGDKIIYRQTTEVSCDYFDNKETVDNTEDLFEYEIYYVDTERYYQYLWHDGVYYNRLESNLEIDPAELKRIMEGVSPRE